MLPLSNQTAAHRVVLASTLHPIGMPTTATGQLDRLFVVALLFMVTLVLLPLRRLSFSAARLATPSTDLEYSMPTTATVWLSDRSFLGMPTTAMA
jgi:hypothetical protein